MKTLILLLFVLLVMYSLMRYVHMSTDFSVDFTDLLCVFAGCGETQFETSAFS